MSTDTDQLPGALLAERLGMAVIKREGHDLVTACIKCSSSDGMRIHQDSGVGYCHVCNRSWSRLELATAVLGDQQQAWRVLEAVGLEQPRSNGHANGAPADPLELVARQKSVTPEALRAYGATVDRGAVVLPVYGPDGQPCSSFSMRPGNGKGLFEKDKPSGMFFPGRFPQPGEPWHIVEGCKDAAALFALGLGAAGLPTSSMNSKFARLFRGTDVVIVPDRDRPGEDGARKTARILRGVAKTVRIASLPAEFRDTKGDDVRDVLKMPNGRELLLQALADAVSTVDESKQPAADLDAATEAAEYIESRSADGVPAIRYWRGSFVRWMNCCYVDVSPAEVRCDVVEFLNSKYFKLGAHMTSNVMDQLKAKSLLPAAVEQPTWLNRKASDWPADGVLSSRNGLVRIADLAEGKPIIMRPTPRFFTPTALPCDVSAEAPAPALWLKFLGDLWPDDLPSIETLQEWFGYCLVNDTSQQKILMLVGPKRSGKGTIARILRALVGNANTAGPTLSSLSQNFGLWPLLGKTLAIISDARLSGRTDAAVVVERLLSISGEDPLTIDRKNLEPITCKLSARLMVMTNELPRLGDASGAMTSRIVLLHMTQSFYGREDHGLTDRLLMELPGILLWAVAGWKRLNARGYFVQPDSGREALDDLDELTSPIGAFVKECCLLGPAYRASVSDLYAEWCKWCDSNGRKEHGVQQMFGRDLAAAVPGIKKTQPRDGSGSRYRAYEGIAIKSESSLGF